MLSKKNAPPFSAEQKKKVDSFSENELIGSITRMPPPRIPSQKRNKQRNTVNDETWKKSFCRLPKIVLFPR